MQASAAWQGHGQRQQHALPTATMTSHNQLDNTSSNDCLSLRWYAQEITLS
jgi:hypothetical protein